MKVDLFPVFPRWRWHSCRWGGLLIGLLSLSAPLAAVAATKRPAPAVVKPCDRRAARRSPMSDPLPCDRADADLWSFVAPGASKVRDQPVTSFSITAARFEPERTNTPSAGIGPQAEPAEEATSLTSSVQQVDVDPAIIEGSPVLQRWLEEVPNLAVDIVHDPAFRTRVRVGYAEFPSTDNTQGIYVGVQDVFVGRTPLTLSAEYGTNGQGDRQTIGADAQYYLLPLGWYGNIAPVIGYRDIQTSTFASEGVNLGLRVVFIPSRTGTADLSVTQSWVAPGSDREVGLTTFTAGYAIAEDWRIGTDVQIQNTRDRQESRVGILLEWML